MAATTMATAAGAVVLLYYLLSRRLSSTTAGDDNDSAAAGFSKSNSRSAKKRLVRRPAQAPATWLETISTLSETLRFTYSETLGKWSIADLAFGINYLIRRQGNLQVASVHGGENCVQLKGPEIINQLYHYLRLLTICMLFSKKPFQVFLATAGYSEVATGAVVPFHHSVLHGGGISNLVLGYAHCGMVAAAQWIAKLSIPSLLKALEQNPDYQVKIVGHSLGGGTAALLTYIIWEQKELSASTCITFAPAACMTWELAESEKHFIATIVNGSDLVPTFSAASVDDLRSELTSSSWLNDLRDQVEQNRVLNVIYCSSTAVGSHLPSMAKAKARVAGAGALLRPVFGSTRVVMKCAQDVAQALVRTRSSISSWTCMGPRHHAVAHSSRFGADDSTEASLLTDRKSEYLASEVSSSNSQRIKADLSFTSNESRQCETDEEGDLIQVDEVAAASTIEEITEGELWYELEKELERQEDEADIQIKEEEEAAVKEITEEEKVLADMVKS